MNEETKPEHISLPRFWWSIVMLTVEHYGRMHSSLLAAAIAYYALVCLAPLSVLGVLALQQVAGSIQQAQEQLRQILGAVFPAPEQILALLGRGLSQPPAVFGGLLGLATLAWAGLRLFEAIERGLTVVWAAQPRRHIVVRKLIAVASLAAVGLLGGAFLLTMSLTAWLRQVVKESDMGSQLIANVAWRPDYTVALAVFILSFLALFVGYKLLPEGRVANRSALLAALSAALLAQVAGRLFNFVVARIVGQSMVYGALTWVVAFCLWAYFGATILLVSAHLGWAYETQRAAVVTGTTPDRHGSC